jgi:fructosamine-3-kinase
VDGAAQKRLERLLGSGILAARSLGGQHGAGHYRLELADGRTAFAKIDAAVAGRAGPGFAAEASGLHWLAAANAVPVPEVLGWDEGTLAIGWIAQEAADGRAALRFGRELAALHAAGADRFGAPWPGVIAGLPLPNEPLPNEPPPNGGGPNEPLPNGGGPNEPLPNGGGPNEPLPGGGPSNGPGAAGPGWPEWYARARLLPYVRLARDAGNLTAADVTLVESAAVRAAVVAGPAEPPSRIHGDCWSGNVLWSGGRGWLVDPAAHGGHRESDLAMLALFGASHLGQIMAGYQEVAPLAEGWQRRVPLHQLHPLLVHVCLFGAAYTGPTLAAARAVLAS